MRFQSYSSLPRTVSDVKLDPVFPCYIHYFHKHKDRPITYLHAHNCMEIGYCHEGTGVFVVEGNVFPFAPGDVSVIFDSQMHLARSTEGTTSLWTWIYLDPIRMVTLGPRDQSLMDPSAMNRSDFGNIIKPADDPTTGEIVCHVIEEVRRQPRAYQTAVCGLICTLMVRLHRLLPSCKAKRPQTDRRDALHRIAEVLEYLAGHYTETIHIDELAGRCNVSEPTLRRLFHTSLGMAPLEYLIRLRIQMASSLLIGTDRPVLNIASDVGFDTLSSFNRHFKSQMGLSPREWRKQKR
jgi:AraC-like DNA-binding protein